MHVIEVVRYWPPETFIVRHMQSMSAVEGLSLSTFAWGKRLRQSASIDARPKVTNKVQYVRDFRAFYLLEKTPSLVKKTFYKWSDTSVLRYFQRKKPDVIHFHFSSSAVAFDKYLQALSIPYTVGIRGSDIQVTPLMQGEKDNDHLCEVLSRASRIHTVCDTFHEEVHSLCNSHPPIQTVRTCIPIPATIPRQPEATNKMRFITVGRLHWVKGLHDLIRAMAFLPDAELDIVGEGEERAHLTYLIHTLGLKNRVRILGKLPYEEFEPLLTKATAYVQSSLAEGFSNSLAEAMALGKAVFVTPAGGTAEIISDHVNGIFIPTGDPAGIAEKLKLAGDHDLLQRIGKFARETAEKTFSMQNHAQQFADFFRKALEQ